MSPAAALAAAAVLVLARPAPAQDVAGTWRATWANDVRIRPDGSSEALGFAGATLVLRQQDEQITGTWRFDAGEVTWPVQGTLRDGRLDLSARAPSGGEAAPIESLRWRGTLEGGSLKGDMLIVLRERRREPAWRAWHAERAPPG